MKTVKSNITSALFPLLFLLSPPQLKPALSSNAPFKLSLETRETVPDSLKHKIKKSFDEVIVGDNYADYEKKKLGFLVVFTRITDLKIQIKLLPDKPIDPHNYHLASPDPEGYHTFNTAFKTPDQTAALSAGCFEKTLRVDFSKSQDSLKMGRGFLPILYYTVSYPELPDYTRMEPPDTINAADSSSHMVYFESKSPVTTNKFCDFLNKASDNLAAEYRAWLEQHPFSFQLTLDKEQNSYSPRAKFKDRPMTEVSRDDAVKYCEWLNNKDTRQKPFIYRLPNDHDGGISNKPEKQGSAGGHGIWEWRDTQLGKSENYRLYARTPVDSLHQSESYPQKSGAYGKFRGRTTGFRVVISCRHNGGR